MLGTLGDHGAASHVKLPELLKVVYWAEADRLAPSRRAIAREDEEMMFFFIVGENMSVWLFLLSFSASKSPQPSNLSTFF
jgi:hypothetical protein